MLIIAAAIYSEAKPFIESLHLKKDTGFKAFQVFRNEDTRLVITGTGPMEAAITAASFLAREAPGTNDLFLNIGVCGSRSKEIPIGTPILCNQIMELETGRTFYPDILYNHPFREGSIISSCRIQTAACTPDYSGERGNYADMEAAALYQAGSRFFQPHRMFFVKVVSDYLEDGLLDKSTRTIPDLNGLMAANRELILHWLAMLKTCLSEDYSNFTPEETEYIYNLAEDLKLSVTMTYELRQHLLYYKLTARNFISYIETLKQDLTLPAKSKTEGKKYLDYFKKNLL